MTAPGVVDVTTVDDPGADPRCVVVAVAATGICGTDLHISRGEIAALPVVPGHEIAGTIVAVGDGVSGLSVGDRVAIDPNLPCQACRSCRAGRQNLCESLEAIGVTMAGGAAQFVPAPAANCYLLPEGIDLTAAALIEPLSCAVHAFDVIHVRLGASVLVYGAGTMGLMLTQLAASAGAAQVDVVEVVAVRRAVAADLGVGVAAGSADDLDRPDGWDVVIDATGAIAAIRDAITRVATGGVYLQFGVSSPDAETTWRPFDIYRREITITGAMAVHASFGRAVDLLARGAIDPSLYITRRAPLDDYADALAGFAQGNGRKTLVLP